MRYSLILLIAVLLISGCAAFRVGTPFSKNLNLPNANATSIVVTGVVLLVTGGIWLFTKDRSVDQGPLTEADEVIWDYSDAWKEPNNGNSTQR